MGRLRTVFRALGCALLTVTATAAPPQHWDILGVGGGGAMFSPSFSPHNPGELYVACDMTELFHTTNLGEQWEMVDYRELQGNRGSKVHFTTDANVLYTLDYTTVAGEDLVRPSKSTDGGATWTPLAADPTFGEVFYLEADPGSTQRLFVTSYTTLYYSGDGGATFNARFTSNVSGAGLHVGGAFWDGANIYVGTNAGLLVSANGGDSFAVDGTTGIPSGYEIVRFSGAKENTTTRLWALLTDDGIYSGIQPEDLFWPVQRVFTLDSGASSWVERGTGLPTTNGNSLAFIATAHNDIDIAWASGQFSNEHPALFKYTEGSNWEQSLLSIDNENAITGWAGDGGDRGWSYGAGTVGLGVAPNNADYVAFTDYGFVHLTTDGGANWRQAYTSRAHENPANADTPQGSPYASAGLENTSCWNLTWSDADNIWASMTDIRGIRTTDGGATWSFNYSGHNQNTSYDCVRHPSTGTLYMATSTVHDIYQTTYLTDSRIDGGDGRVLSSTDGGLSWNQVHDFNHPVIDLELHPTNSEVMYASVIHSSEGGIYRTGNLSAGSGAIWTKLAEPPRTEGHPFNIKVLADGTLVATYCGRRTSSFTQSSGVFVSTNDGASWIDRSHANMTYYVKDIVIDPHDVTENTWYVGVWSGWGGPLATNNQAGGLYRTTDRGQNWERIFETHRVSHCAVSPVDPDVLYVTTETDGLWYTENLSDSTPMFADVASFPFRQPERIFFSPFDNNEVWVTTFGHGIQRGTMSGGGMIPESWIAY